MPEAVALHPESPRMALALSTARGILSGEVAVLDGCIQLASLARNIVADPVSDPDLVVFIGIASEVDDLPFGEARERWGAGALARADEEIAGYTTRISDSAMCACKGLIARFDVKGSPQ